MSGLRLALSLFFFAAPAAERIAEPMRPNIIVIVADDLGYADLGFQGSKDIPTPNLDSLAKSGIVCTNGYVTHPFCSPTRAGLLTGRYQQRFGHENNPVWNPEDSTIGLDLKQVTIADHLKQAGYVTGAVGKWHLGAHPSFHPNRRGFETYFGALGGGHDYFDHNQFQAKSKKATKEYFIPLVRNQEPVAEAGYLTEVFGREAERFVETNQAKPFFLYLAFNAPHTPLQVPEAYVQRVREIADEKRQKYAGMICALDDAVGKLVNKLHQLSLAQNTLVFFISDNGGPVAVTNSSNQPLRGAKGNLYEGGVRVPFVVSWPEHLEPGTFSDAVTSLDIFATAAALSGQPVRTSQPLDGLNLMPWLTKEAEEPMPARSLYWRTGGGTSFAVRKRNYKLVKPANGSPELYDLATDIRETKNLADTKTELLAELTRDYEGWNRQLVPPNFGNPPTASKKTPSKKKRDPQL